MVQPLKGRILSFTHVARGILSPKLMTAIQRIPPYIMSCSFYMVAMVGIVHYTIALLLALILLLTGIHHVLHKPSTPLFIYILAIVNILAFTVVDVSFSNTLSTCGHLLTKTRLAFLRFNQGQLRAALYSCLEDWLRIDEVGNPQELGQQAVLPSSYIGGPQHLQQHYQDAMAIMRFSRDLTYSS